MYIQLNFQKNSKYNLIGVGCSNENSYRIFDGDNHYLPCANSNYLEKSCYSVDFSNNGNYFAYGCGDGNVRVLSIEKIKKNI